MERKSLEIIPLKLYRKPRGWRKILPNSQTFTHFPHQKNPPLIDLHLLLSKVSFRPHQTAMNDWSSPKQNFHFLYLSIPSLPPMLFQKPCLNYCLFSYFLNSLFYFKLYKISTDSTTPIGILWLCGLIKYNGFRISGNKSYKTPYPMP